WIELNPSGFDQKIMSAVLEADTPHFDDVHLAPRRSIFTAFPLHSNDPVGNALELLLTFASGAIVEHQHCALSPRKELFESQNLAAITDASLRKNFQLRHGVESYALG